MRRAQRLLPLRPLRSLGQEAVGWTSVDIRDRKAIKAALEATIRQFGGIDILINHRCLVSFVAGWCDQRRAVGVDAGGERDGELSADG